MTSSDCYAPSAMAQQDPEHKSFIAGDPWRSFAYLVTGVGVYGLLGWLVDRWLGTSFLVVVGILLGAVLGIYLTWARFRSEPAGPPPASSKNVTNQEKQ